MRPLSLDDTAQTIAIIRDFVLIVAVPVAVTGSLLLFRKMSKMLDSVAATTDRVEDIAGTLSDRIIGPAAAGTGVAFGAGKLAAFILGFSRPRKKKEEGGDDGE